MPKDFSEDVLDGKILVHSYENEPLPGKSKSAADAAKAAADAAKAAAKAAAAKAAEDAKKIADALKKTTTAAADAAKAAAKAAAAKAAEDAKKIADALKKTTTAAATAAAAAASASQAAPSLNWSLFNIFNKQQSDADMRLADANKIADSETKRANDLDASIRVSSEKIRGLESQLSQLVKTNNNLENILREKQILIDKKKKHIDFLTQENKRLRKKTNSLLDKLQYYRTMALGNETVDGYENVIVKQEIRYKELLEQEIGKPISKPKKEGFLGTSTLDAMRKRLDETNLNISYAITRGNEQTLRAANLTKTLKDSTDRIQNLEIQIKQFTANISKLNYTIMELDIFIGKINKEIEKLNKENMRLRKKVNAIIDNLQYFRTLVLGNTNVDGYKDTVVRNQIKYEDLLQQEIGILNDKYKKEGLENLINLKTIETSYEPFEYVQEGFVEGTASYNAVFTENQILKNKIDTTTNTHSIDNQLFTNTKRKINNLKFANYILIFVFCGTFLYGCYSLFKHPEMNDLVKVLFAIGMLLSIIILHTIEYAILIIFPYISALLIGSPYDPSEYWKKPGIYDYLPTP